MEIIKDGVIPPCKTYTGICSNCGVVISAEESELNIQLYTLYTLFGVPVCTDIEKEDCISCKNYKTVLFTQDKEQ